MFGGTYLCEQLLSVTKSNNSSEKIRTNRQTFAIADYNGNNAQFKIYINNTRENKKNHVYAKCPDRCETS
jgi:formylglycine-generating enzyme required for sulfatase activity